MAGQLIGQPGMFNPESETWVQYSERVAFFFQANEVAEGRRKAMLLSLMGPTAYKLLRSLSAPSKPDDKSYADLVAAMEKHHDPVPSEIVQRYKFNSRVKKPAKAILYVIGDDIALAAGPLQTCAGQSAGSEAAIHAMKNMFDDSDCEAALLVDATNAFNCVNRQAALHNISILCPAFSTILNNTYAQPVRLFVVGEGETPSCEGTTQGDPLAMAMYALAVVPLIKRLRVAVPSVGQVWFADDATAVGKLKLLHKWWQILSSLGPNFGYFSNASKTVLIVKPHLLTIAKSIFADTGMEITDKGQRHLGAALGSREFAEGFVAKKVCSWSSEVLALAEIATNRPHAAFCAFTHGMISGWVYIMRTIPNVGPLFQPLEDAIRLKLIPALTGHGACSALERDVLSLPCRLGGLGIVNPVDIADSQFAASIKITHSLRSLIVAQNLLAPLPDVSSIKAYMTTYVALTLHHAIQVMTLSIYGTLLNIR